MGKFIDLTGQKFGRLTAVSRAGNAKNGNVRWNCICECNNTCVVDAWKLINSHTASCGCLNREKVIERFTLHGLANSKLYRIWCDIKQRCLNPNCPNYHNYGGRNISMFPNWAESFVEFYNYVSLLPHYDDENYTLDRINNDGNYEPGNVRWIKREMQSRNTRRNIFVDYNGIKMLLVDVAKITGINYNTLQNRMKRGDTGDKLFRPVKKRIPKSDLILVQNNQALTTSLIVAEKFGKLHKNVIAAIENAMETLKSLAESTELKIKPSEIERAFIKGEYKDASGKSNPMYYLNRDALSFVIMGFTGEKAALWKWRYIQEFNRMEAALS